LAIANLRPDFVTIDRDLIHGVHSSETQRAVVVSLLSFATHINARIIAAGIESAEDLTAVIALGIHFGQGKRLGVPVILGSAPANDAVATEPGVRSVHSVECFPSDMVATAPRRTHTHRDLAVNASPRASLPHALSTAALALQAEHDPQRILTVIAEQLSLVVPVDDLSIYEADHANHRFVPAFATGPQASDIMADAFLTTTSSRSGDNPRRESGPNAAQRAIRSLRLAGQFPELEDEPV
jgi:hypothetical protein